MTAHCFTENVSGKFTKKITEILLFMCFSQKYSSKCVILYVLYGAFLLPFYSHKKQGSLF